MKCQDCLRTQLTARISIDQAVEAVTDDGDAVITWTTLAEPWAKVEHSTLTPTMEGFESEQKFSEIRTIFTIRYSSAITPTSKDVIVWDGETYEITNHYNYPAGRPSETRIHTTKRTD